MPALDSTPKEKIMVRMVLVIVVAFTMGAAVAQDFYAPNENLVVEGVPEIPMTLVEDVSRYTEFRAAGFSDWHPKKRELLMRTRFADTYQLHHVAQPGAARTQLTFFEEPVGGVSYQPTHGDYVVFTMDVGGGEFYQVFRFDIASRNVTMLSDGEKRNSSPLFNRKGDRIIYSRVDANDDGAFTELHVMDPMDLASDRVVTTLSGGGWYVMDWDERGRNVLCLEYRSINESYIHEIELDSGEVTRLFPRQTEDPAYYGYTTYAKGGGYFTVTDAFSEFRQLAYFDDTESQPEIITERIPWDVSDYAITRDRDRIAYTTNEAGTAKLHAISLKPRKEIKLPSLPLGQVSSIVWNAKGDELGFTLNSARSPSDVHSIQIDTGKLVRWTTSETGMMTTDDFVEPKLIEWESFDGRMISGFMYEPPSKFKGKRPVIVSIHGGPESQWQPRFLGRSNYWLNELGVAIIYPNVRGSSGYGKTFVKLDNGFDREGSYRDIEALFNWMGEQRQIDSDKIMVTGGSYGGFMTLAVAANYSDRIACAVDIVGISNLRTFLENTQGYRRDLRRAEYGDERDPAMYEFLEKIAPLNHVTKMRKPMFVVQGANDPRVPKSEADQIVAALKETRTPVWYLVANDEGHGFAKKANADYQFYATVMFIKEHLLGP